MKIIQLPIEKKWHASNVLAASFFNYPMFKFYFPDEKRRKKYLPWYFDKILNCALLFGEVNVIEDVSGVIFNLPPGHTKMSLWDYIRSGFFLTPFKLGLRNYYRSMECERCVEEMQEELMGDRPRCYLWGLAVDPQRKKKGVGSALLRNLLERSDAEGLPVYLETHDENNLPYYQQYGFELLKKAIIPKYDLPFWCMVREPVG